MNISLLTNNTESGELANTGNNLTNVPNNNELEIDIGDVAKKALASLVLSITNSVLTITVIATKLTGFAIIPSMAIGWLTKPLHSANAALAEHAFSPLKEWTKILKDENRRIIETDKIITIRDSKLIFYPNNYNKQALDSLKVIVAPISLSFSTINAVLGGSN